MLPVGQLILCFKIRYSPPFAFPALCVRQRALCRKNPDSVGMIGRTWIDSLSAEMKPERWWFQSVLLLLVRAGALSKNCVPNTNFTIRETVF